MGDQVDHRGRGQHFGNSILSIGRNNGRFLRKVCGRRGVTAGKIEGIGDLIEAVVEQVPVDVHRHGRTGVTEHLLDDLDIRAGRDTGEAGGGVPQLVWMDPVRADGRHGGVEAGAEDVHPQRTTTADAGEHELTWIFAGNVGVQFVDEKSGNWHLSALVALGRTPHQPVALHAGTDAAMVARRRARSRRPTRNAASSPKRTPV